MIVKIYRPVHKIKNGCQLSLESCVSLVQEFHVFVDFLLLGVPLQGHGQPVGIPGLFLLKLVLSLSSQIL